MPAKAKPLWVDVSLGDHSAQYVIENSSLIEGSRKKPFNGRRFPYGIYTCNTYVDSMVSTAVVISIGRTQFSSLN